MDDEKKLMRFILFGIAILLSVTFFNCAMLITAMADRANIQRVVGEILEQEKESRIDREFIKGMLRGELLNLKNSLKEK